MAEELGEFRTELDRMDKADPGSVKRAEGELGDFLFSVVNAARLYAKFRRRFTYLEEHTIRQGRSLKDMTLAEMDALWNEAKALESAEMQENHKGKE